MSEDMERIAYYVGRTYRRIKLRCPNPECAKFDHKVSPRLIEIRKKAGNITLRELAARSKCKACGTRPCLLTVETLHD